MSDIFMLSKKQFNRIQPYFSLSHGIPRVDDHRVMNGIISVIRNGLQWKDAPSGYGPPKTLYNPFGRWSRTNVFNRKTLSAVKCKILSLFDISGHARIFSARAASAFLPVAPA
jgi:transposase